MYQNTARSYVFKMHTFYITLEGRKGRYRSSYKRFNVEIEESKISTHTSSSIVTPQKICHFFRLSGEPGLYKVQLVIVVFNRGDVEMPQEGEVVYQ